MTTAAQYIQNVRALPCVVCRLMGLAQSTPTAAHHIGDTASRSDWLVISLCHEHHQGATGFHGLGERAFNRRYNTTELRLLGETIAALAKRKLA